MANTTASIKENTTASIMENTTVTIMETKKINKYKTPCMFDGGQ